MKSPVNWRTRKSAGGMCRARYCRWDLPFDNRLTPLADLFSTYSRTSHKPLREEVAYGSLDHSGSKLCLISILWQQRLTPCFKHFVHVKSQFREKNPASYWNTSVSCTTQEYDNVNGHLIIQFPLYYLRSGRLWEVKNKRKFQTFSCKCGRVRLKEIPHILIW